MPFNSPNMSQQNVRTFGRIDSLASLNPSKIFPAILFVTDIWGLRQIECWPWLNLFTAQSSIELFRFLIGHFFYIYTYIYIHIYI